jgi:APA family basic amino acid/polyamine antiporter
LSVTAPSAVAAAAAARGSRALGLLMCTALIVGNVIGIGIFLLPASLAPYGLNALTGWLITVTGCAFLAVSFAGLARAFPDDDGPYDYMRRAFGDGVPFAVMWCYWASIWVSNATIAVGVVGYLTVFVPALNSIPWLPPFTALALLWFFVFVNLLGVRTVGWAQVVTSVLKLMPLLGVICLAVWILLTHPSAFAQHVPPNPPSLGDVSNVSTLALFAMLGIECAMIPACRVRNPAKTIPRATVLGAVVTGLIFMCVSIVPVLLFPQKALAASNAPFADLFSQFLGGHFGEVIALFVVISGLGALNGWTLMIGEVTQGIARHGYFPPSLARENANGAPTGALVVSGVIASVLMISNYSQSITALFTFLSVLTTAATLPLYFACSIAILVLNRRGSIAWPGRKAGFWTAVAIFAAVYCVWVSIAIGIKPLLWTLALSAASGPIYCGAVYFRRRAVAA